MNGAREQAREIVNVAMAWPQQPSTGYPPKKIKSFGQRVLATHRRHARSANQRLIIGAFL